jgi:glycogen synthase
VEGKLAARRKLRERTGLRQVDGAPILFWPSRLDPIQKGPQLLAQIMYQVISDYWKDDLQIVIVANGVYQSVFHDIVRQHDFYGRVAVCNFDENLSRLAYAASDFILMPSSFEPCGLPQMIAPIYGSLSIVHNTGGLKDTVEHLDVAADEGNGFAFDHFDTIGLRWAIDEAMRFFKLPDEVRHAQITRIMSESLARFNHAECAHQYFEIYEDMLHRPLFNPAPA